jgi:hypothetical protein
MKDMLYLASAGFRRHSQAWGIWHKFSVTPCIRPVYLRCTVCRVFRETFHKPLIQWGVYSCELGHPNITVKSRFEGFITVCRVYSFFSGMVLEGGKTPALKCDMLYSNIGDGNE